MKTLSKFLLILLLGLSTLSGCSYMVYWLTYRQTNTWYFKVDFDRKTIKEQWDFQIEDSINISKSAIRLIRKKEDSVYCYWVDFDTISNQQNRDRLYLKLKIVGKDGGIKRFLGGWFNVDPEKVYQPGSFIIQEERDGDLVFIHGDEEFKLMHLGDEMGIHHSEIVRPKNIPHTASLNAEFEAYYYEYTWSVFQNLESGFIRLYIYDYQGYLKDSIFSYQPETALKPNYFFKSSYKELVLYNDGKKQRLEIDQNPFRGFGADTQTDVLDPDLQNFEKGSYCYKVFSSIFNQRGQSFTKFRNPKNLEILNATIKAIGYDKFLSEKEFFTPKWTVTKRGISPGHELSTAQYIDSLLYYHDEIAQHPYYDDFWTRRKKEGTERTVLLILIDLKRSYSQDNRAIPTELVNDTLKTCLEFDLRFQNTEGDSAKKLVLEDYYQQLHKYGFTQSAFNLIFNQASSAALELQDKYRDDFKSEAREYRVRGQRRYLNPYQAVWFR